MRVYLAAVAALLILPAPCLAAVDFTLPLCSAVAPATDPNSDLARRRDEMVSLPLVGVESEAEVGQSMVLKLNYTAYAGSLDLKAPIEFAGRPAGSNRGNKEDWKVSVPSGRYLLASTMNPYNAVSAFVAPDVKPRRASDDAVYPTAVVGLRPGIDTLELVWVKDRGLWNSGPITAPFSLNYCAIVSAGNFRRELVYSGVSKGTVSLSYREFVTDMARPAFTQDLRYDLAEGDEIGFRGARFKVLKATNTMIRYQVLKPLD